MNESVLGLQDSPENLADTKISTRCCGQWRAGTIRAFLGWSKVGPFAHLYGHRQSLGPARQGDKGAEALFVVDMADGHVVERFVSELRLRADNPGHGLPLTLLVVTRHPGIRRRYSHGRRNRLRWKVKFAETRFDITRAFRENPGFDVVVFHWSDFSDSNQEILRNCVRLEMGYPGEIVVVCDDPAPFARIALSAQEILYATDTTQLFSSDGALRQAIDRVVVRRSQTA